MTHQIERLSPHQNGKVFGVLMALASSAVLVPISVMFLLLPAPPGAEGSKSAVLVFLFLPLFYLVCGYAFVAIGCWFYNLMFKYIGGVEFQTTGERGAA